MNKHIRFGALVAVACVSFANSYAVDFSSDTTLQKIVDRIAEECFKATDVTTLTDLKTQAQARVTALELRVDDVYITYLQRTTNTDNPAKIALIKVYQKAIKTIDDAIKNNTKNKDGKLSKTTKTELATPTTKRAALQAYVNGNETIEFDTLKKLIEEAQADDKSFAPKLNFAKLEQNIKSFKEALDKVFNPKESENNAAAGKQAVATANALDTNIFPDVAKDTKTVVDAIAAAAEAQGR